jgi:hypothetical protein
MTISDVRFYSSKLLKEPPSVLRGLSKKLWEQAPRLAATKPLRYRSVHRFAESEERAYLRQIGLGT